MKRMIRVDLRRLAPRHPVTALAAIAAASMLAACSSILGLTNPSTDDNVVADGGTTGDGATTGDGSGGDGSTGDDGSTPGDGSGGDASCAPGADFTADKANCGRCGHSCLGGDCTGGVCQPVTIAVAQSNPFGVAVQGSRVYWTNNGNDTVMMADKADGKNVGPVAASGISSPWGILTDNTSVYWANHDFKPNGTIAKCPLAGCTANGSLSAPATLAVADEPLGLAIAGNRLFFTEDNGGGVWSIDTSDGGTPLNLAPGGINHPFKIVTDGTYVYFTSNETALHSVSVKGGPIFNLVNAPDQSGLAIDQGTLFFTNYPFSSNSGSIASVSKDGGTATGFAGSQVNPLNVVVDANYVYWTNNGTFHEPAQADDGKDGSVVACARPGPCTKPIVLADKQHIASGITIDDEAVYWTNAGVGGVGNNDGAVMKIAKP